MGSGQRVCITEHPGGRELAIIGGGAAGLICAHLLDTRHRVTVYERQPILGGNIRTLGVNVTCPKLPPGVVLDAGVIEFCPEHFPVFHRLLERLDIAVTPVPATTSLIHADGFQDRSPGSLGLASLPFSQRWAARARLLQLAPEFLRFRRRAGAADPNKLYHQSLSDFLEDGPVSEWLRLLMVYGYSIPRDRVDDMPAALTIPTLLQFTGRPSWTCLPGGVYTYISAILKRMRGQVVTDADVRVRRNGRGVSVSRKQGEIRRFDAVIFACPPDQVLQILEDPTDAERRRFGPWKTNQIVTIIHDDDGIYTRYGVRDFSEFDVFTNPPGYNAFLNRLAGLPKSTPRHFHFSYNLDGLIRDDRVIHRQPHQTPLYTRIALASRPEVIACNGESNTYFAGAWLGNGLHEGAAQSALDVSRLLGGTTC